MPSRDHREDLKLRLASKKYASTYLETAFRESCRDQDWAAFGLALKSVIEAQAKDLSQFAKEAGVSRQHLYLLFGNRSNPTLNTLIPILDELDLSISIRPVSGSRNRALDLLC